MADTNSSKSDGKETSSDDKSRTSAPPIISLPKGGGAIRGMGEKFAANPVTGSGSMTVPIATSPGRGGFGPQLSLSYDSGAGNGPFGFGWSLALPSITRKTDKGLPLYREAQESDVFILSGAEDLVPVFKKNEDGAWARDKKGEPVYDEEPREGYLVRRYRPRIEGLFARIERWTNQADATDTFWRSISKENITIWYGKRPESRIADPADPTRIFSWQICEGHDDKGNAILYRYLPEDSAGVERSQVHEKNRTDRSRSAQRYLKAIQYGNRTPRREGEDLTLRTDWLFEAVFDYGDGHMSVLPNDAEGRERFYATRAPRRPWPARQDPFSSYRAGFEVRTYRLCRQVLMFHHFPDELGTPDCLVRSTEFAYRETPLASFLTKATQSGYLRKEGTYRKRSLPPLEFEYSAAIINEEIRELDPDSLENLPIGLDGAAYQWVDLDGEGLSGILTEQATAWFYKRNLGGGRFAPLERVTPQPTPAALSAGRQQLLDLAGDGRLDLTAFDGPTPGYFKRTGEKGWEAFTPFDSLPNILWSDPNLKFVDLTGDGHADILITEDEAFTWYPSLAEEGFGPAEKVRQALEEERGPKLVFADGTESIHLADMSGDGLTDLVRIRNGEVCYWPNLGYGRFGAKVTMDNAPWFDAPDLFDQKRILLADIDGSGVTDLIYLSGDAVRLYFNHSGNRFSEARRLTRFPAIDSLRQVTVVDLLGSGTACLVWSSPLPGESQTPFRYIDLMNEGKPHLLTRVINNLGAETGIQYAPSTKFYLADQAAGKPWITKLPFPVHCVEKVTVRDRWRKTAFSTTYSYHHGYFDGIEREFRGFGRVEQVDVEDYGTFLAGNVESPYIADDQTLYQPPVKTVTWFHTGAFFDRERILTQFQKEYFAPHTDRFREHDLPQPDLAAQALSAEEWREALRACKGMMLRQETYELAVDPLHSSGEAVPVKLFSTAYHNCLIQRLQPREKNKHAVFLVTESEAITYHYELDLRAPLLQPDPRIAHTLNLTIDEIGNVLQSVAAVYPRVGRYADPKLPEGAEPLIERVQKERHLAYTETRYTNDVNEPDAYRLPLPCEVRTYELTEVEDDRAAPEPRDNRYHTIDALRRLRLSDVYPPKAPEGEVIEVKEIAYHQRPDRTTWEKRPVEQVRMLYFDVDLKNPLPFRHLNALGLPYETYKLALTDDLLAAVFADKRTAEVTGILSNPNISGYASGESLAGANIRGQYWIRSGISGFADDAQEHFYLPERYTDPFGNITTLEYDGKYDLFVQSSTDPLQNRTEVVRFDFRVLAPLEIKDINDNLSEVAFDLLGMPAAVALKGKGRGNEGDTLENVPIDIDPERLWAFFNDDFDEAEAKRLLANATARHLYYLGELRDGEGRVTYGHHPASACAIVREIHLAQLGEGETSPVQVAFEYSDGAGTVLVKKAQAEPEEGGTALRWLASGKTILNNKGKPVKQYEPYFSPVAHRFEEPVEAGVTPVMYYDAVGRLVRTELPDGSFSRVDFSPWQAATYDQNDTVKESRWYAVHASLDPDMPIPRDPITGEFLATPDQVAAWKAAQHASTPTTVFLDTLGREVVSVAHNRYRDFDGALRDEKDVTFTKLDAEGKPLWVRDARGNRVMQYIRPYVANNAESDPTVFAPCYDIAGNLLFQHSMDAGDRWMLMDAAGKPMLAWDFNERQTDAGPAPERRLFFTEYDGLHRPLTQKLGVNEEPPAIVERFIYGEPPEGDAAAREAAQEKNLLGQAQHHYDPSGLVTHERFDFKGNLLEVTRRLASAYDAPVIDWSEGSPTSGLEEEVFRKVTEYDALSRMTRLYNWHNTPERVAVYEPRYNRRGLLEGESLVTRAARTESGYVGGERTKAISEVAYNAKGQQEQIRYGNGTITRYDYDPLTFRLTQLRTTRPSFDPDFPRYRSGLAEERVLQQLSYTYDPVGNITEIYDEAYEPVFFSNQRVEPRNRYTYDALYRLIETEGRENYHANGAPGQFEDEPFTVRFPVDGSALRNYTQHYTYDSVGNFIDMRHTAERGSWTRHYETALDSNRLLRTWLGGDASNAVRYDYDTHGSMLNLNRKPEEYRLRWDHRDMIHNVNLGGGGQAYYNYDTAKQRTRKRIEQLGGTVEERLYLGGMERYRRDIPAGAVVEEIETHHLFVGEQRVLIVEDVLSTDNTNLDVGTLYRYQYSNYLGSVGLELDRNAAVISYEEYHSFGAMAYRATSAGVRATAKRYRYTGMERDEETGLSYHTARYYLVWLGRWGSVDPAIHLYPQMNSYSYCFNSPIQFLDQNGLQPRRLRVGDVLPEPDAPPTPVLEGQRAATTTGGRLRAMARRARHDTNARILAGVLTLPSQQPSTPDIPSDNPVATPQHPEYPQGDYNPETDSPQAARRSRQARRMEALQPAVSAGSGDPPPPERTRIRTGETQPLVEGMAVPPDSRLTATRSGEVSLRTGVDPVSTPGDVVTRDLAGEVHLIPEPPPAGSPRRPGDIPARPGDTLVVDAAGEVTGIPPAPPAPHASSGGRQLRTGIGRVARSLGLVIPIAGLGVALATYEPDDPWNIGGSPAEEALIGETPVGLIRDLVRLGYDYFQWESENHREHERRMANDPRYRQWWESPSHQVMMGVR